MKRAIVIWFMAMVMAIGGIGATVADTFAHSYITWVDCRNYNIHGVRHVSVRFNFDYHEAYARSMSYNEYMYYCY